jgi:hypothetical protein
MYSTFYTVIFRYEPANIEEAEEITRLHFVTLDAILRHLPVILLDRLYVVTDALEACNSTVEKMCEHLADPKKVHKFLMLGNDVNVVCAVQAMYV